MSTPFEYLVCCSLVQLCVASQRGRDIASPSALSHWIGLAKVGGYWQSLQTLPVCIRVGVRQWTSFSFQKSGNLNTYFCIDNGSHENLLLFALV